MATPARRISHISGLKKLLDLGDTKPAALIGPSQPPLQGELFSLEQLEQHARTLAAEQHVVEQAGAAGTWLRAIDEIERQLRAAQKQLAADVEQQTAISPAAEWLLDNFHIVITQIHEIRQDLPRGYYRQLPKLADGEFAGTPRVFALALELIAHTEGRITQEALVRFVQAYQMVSPLSMGELWAVAIMLRIGLIENLGRLVAEMLKSRTLRSEADRWSTLLLHHNQQQANGKDDQLLAKLTEAYPDFPPAFAVQLLHQLQSSDSDFDSAPAASWLEQQLVDHYGSAEIPVHLEHQRQAASQVSVGNSITSMRILSAIDWPAWFERVSVAEQVLRQDPAGVYARSTFTTRDRFRHIIEDLARQTRLSEPDIARRLVWIATQAYHEHGGDATVPAAHIGYFLVGPGRAAFEDHLDYRPNLIRTLGRSVLRHPTLTYLGAVATGTVAATAIGMRTAGKNATFGERALAAALLALPASELAHGVVNWCLAHTVPPRVLPRLDLQAGIPQELRTIVVVPMLLLTKESVQGQFDRLEVLMLANSDPHLHFALLSDFADAPAAEMPDDAELLTTALSRVDALNEHHDAEDRFLFFHRRRVLNPSQSTYMGWERKRGKLDEFNRLLAGATDTTFEVVRGDLTILPQIRYVITLDADTQLPRDAAQKLIGTLAHPLNHAIIDPEHGRVVQGYGILQPRVAVDLISATQSRFARIFSGNVGVDPYTTAISDAYMDLFGDGIYAGKGIYDPAVLRTTLDNRFPVNALLSHDLIEGSYTGAGLVTDVELIDSYPTTYAAYAARHHRWVRGDWQIMRWILPLVPDGQGRLTRNVLPIGARYRIFDNLRRSLIPTGTVALLLAGWLRLPGRPIRWTALALGHLALPTVLSLLDTLLALPQARAPLVLLRNRAGDLRMSGIRMAVNTSFLLDQAIIDLDAITRTVWRLFVSRRNLLEWETAEQSQQRLHRSYEPLLRRLAPVVIGAAIIAWAERRQVQRALPAIAPVSTLWGAAPAIAAFLDRPWLPPQKMLSPEDRDLLGMLARQTWRYFEDFVVEETHFLAPDNFQEEPTPVVAKRTSPTNIGLQMLSDLTAHDFGYLGHFELVERTERVLATIAQLKLYRGHLLNWYDTETLEPLPPAYVSSVDSGNLAGYLLVLRQGYLALRDQPIVGPYICMGLQHTIGLLKEELAKHNIASSAHVQELDELVASAPEDVNGYRVLLTRVQNLAGALQDSHQASQTWPRKLENQARSLLRDLDTVLPFQQHDSTHPAINALLESSPSLNDITRTLAEVQDQLAPSGNGTSASESALTTARGLVERHEAIAAQALELTMNMEFGFLYDRERRIFTIGYNVSESRQDNSFYDLLASESRLSSFVAIANGDIPQEHWFHLGRPFAPINHGSGQTVLLSWSGTMFEYLMPLLVMRNFPATLLDQTYQGVVERQKSYARQHNIPWGISESGFNARDLQMNYQYRAFGVPGLGLKGGLGDDLVVAPYATILALLVRASNAIANIRALIDIGARGAYGLYEAIDYTPERVPPGETQAIVHSYMVHHHGMSLIAFDNCLYDNIMQRRFHAEPRVEATELLLQERVAHPAVLETPTDFQQTHALPLSIQAAPREFTTPNTRVPYTQLLSNGTYTIMLTNAGGGLSRYNDLQVTRWREDTTRDAWGSFIYLRDVRSGLHWSAAYQPVRQPAQDYRVIFSPEKVEYYQRTAGIQTRMDVTVASEDNAEVRRLFLTNLTVEPRELEVTSYAEIVLTAAATDQAHPVFSNLSVETEWLPDLDALLASRRPRSAQQERLWALHVVSVRGHTIGPAQFDTDRLSFLGRGRTPAEPVSIDQPLAQHSGAVLDPIFSLRRHIRIAPGATVQIVFTTGIAQTREEAVALAQKYHDPIVVRRAFEMAWTQSRVELRHLGITTDDAHRFQRLAAAAFYPDVRMRAQPDILAANTLPQPNLWAYGVSGDFPIIVVRIADGSEMRLVREVLHAHEFWRLNGLMIELVILNERDGSYLEELQDQLLTLVRTRSGAWLDRRGGIFVVRADRIPEPDKILLLTAARAVLSGRRGDLAQHLRRRDQHDDDIPAALATIPRRATGPEPQLQPLPENQLPSPYGGFSPDGTEYIIELEQGKHTPLPWINVIANEHFGFTVSESGSGYTWSENSRENKLTPWSNDPVSDPPGEAFYLRDDETGDWWQPTLQEAQTTTPPGSHYRVRHGFGYSTFEHERLGIASELTLFAPPDASAKIMHLRLRNTSSWSRRISTVYYCEWTLGAFREQQAPFTTTTFDTQTSTILAHNAYNIDFGKRVAYLATDAPPTSWTCDRTEFIGRNGTLGQPAALMRVGLAGRAGAGLDPCAALQRVIDLRPGETCELVFVLGEGADQADALALANRYRRLEDAEPAREAAVEHWRQLLRQTQVQTPEPSWNVLLNGWLQYQTLSCRIWGRSAFYQSGGAYGYRDQLQDVMAFAVAAPEITRAQIVRAAAHQFIEGDVQHWWHPPADRGIRTKFSDDYLWLPFVTAFYIAVTDDMAVLDEKTTFLEGRALNPDEAEYYDKAEVSNESSPIYDHCTRALDYGLSRMGPHGLPLMGAGDWNDGMNLVGDEGRGESIWVAWFLYLNLRQFSNLATQRGDQQRAKRYMAEATRLQAALEEHAWDGAWYLRAFYDDGTPLGSHTGDECRIDSLTQSWAIISGAAPLERAQQGMEAVDQNLVDREYGLIRLFTPPFDHTPHNPGYIKGYVPGVRENGGQYTHAALWVIWAWALMGNGDRAGELYSLINPIRHAQTNPERYKVEPYVIAADVYAVQPHTGRGGWTWYTGSASWMYRLGTEMLLGLRQTGTWLTITPCIPSTWSGYSACYRYRTATYQIQVENPNGISTGSVQVEVDGKAIPDGRISLADDGATHQVHVILVPAS